MVQKELSTIKLILGRINKLSTNNNIWKHKSDIKSSHTPLSKEWMHFCGLNQGWKTQSIYNDTGSFGLLLGVTDGKSSCINNDDSHREFSQLLEAAFRSKSKGFLWLPLSRRNRKAQLSPRLNSGVLHRTLQYTSFEQKKKRARGTKTLLKRFYRHRANGDSQRHAEDLREIHCQSHFCLSI